MRGLKNFIKTTILGGLLAILPLALLLALLSWLYGFLSSLLTPLRVLLEGNLSWPSIVLNLFIIGIILGCVFCWGWRFVPALAERSSPLPIVIF